MIEKGTKALLYLFIGAAVVGALVLALHPAFRRAAIAMASGSPGDSPILQSNRDYYPSLTDTPNAGE